MRGDQELLAQIQARLEKDPLSKWPWLIVNTTLPIKTWSVQREDDEAKHFGAIARCTTEADAEAIAKLLTV